MMTKNVVAALAFGLAAAFSSSAFAQAGQFRAFGGYVPDPPVNTPFSSRSIGIPGPARTCVKWCEFDDNPCDPPVYKQADGRCNPRF